MKIFVPDDAIALLGQACIDDGIGPMLIERTGPGWIIEVPDGPYTVLARLIAAGTFKRL